MTVPTEFDPHGMSQTVIYDTLLKMRKLASKLRKVLLAELGSTTARVTALSAVAPGYGCVGFRCVDGDGWYAVTGAEFTFRIVPRQGKR